ncbi:signal recognition particle-docking protein FtsY [Glaciecola sp. 2405UD65-10]|uniref:signal recognition particle-docking protein FtsY n=1 Tax=Glaciecola sp. 2405UD65-10 TaxID=3397244 RepID=UPI003B58C981
MSKLFSWFKKSEQKQEQKVDDVVVDSNEALSDESGKSHNSNDSAPLEEQALENEEKSIKISEHEAQEKVSEAQTPTEESKLEEPAGEEAVIEEPAIEEPVSEGTAKLEIAPEVDAQAIAAQPAKEESKGFFSRLKSSLSRTKANIGSGFASLLLGKKIDEDLYEELETHLLLADVGMTTTNKIIERLTDQAKHSQLKDGGALTGLLQNHMQSMLDEVNTPLDFSIAVDENGQKVPFVILMVGVNGVGKTTTIGKLAKQFQAQGKSVMLAAGDTFRAAAVEQLQVWGERNNIPVVAQHTGADSASVLFDAIASAQSKNADVLIADTAGRLQNKDNLIEELKKVVRVMKKKIPNAPHEIMLTLDASTGQNAVSQTKIFNEAVGITGINLTKLDGSAKGGVIFALADEFKIPVRYIGIGEGIEDLREFDSKAFVEALFAE